MVPNGWRNLPLEQIAKFRRGSFPQPYGNPAWIDEKNGYPFVQVFDIAKNMLLKTNTKIKISDAAIGKSVFIPKSTVIVSIQGSIGRVAITQYDAYVDRTILLFQEFTLPTDTIFFAYQIQDLFEIEKTKAPGGTIKTITKEVLRKFTINLPPLPEQQKIATILGTWDKAISTTERLINNSKQQKKALMQQLLTGKKRLLDESGKPFEGEWDDVTVDKVADLTAGATPSTKNSDYWDGNIPWMNSGEINLKQVFSVEGRITALGLQKSSTKEIPKNSVLIALAGQGKTRGTVAINRIKLCTNQSIAAIMPKLSQLDPEFLYFNLDNRYQELRSMSTGDGGRGGLNLSILKSIKLKLPSLPEQQKIASALSNADKEIELLEEQRADLKQEKKALMQQLLTGKFRVKLN